MRYYSQIIEKRNKYCKEIETDSLIALCEMENYDEFCKDLEKIIFSKSGRNLIYKLYDVILGKFVLGSKKYKDFVKKYHDIIDIMKKHKCLCNMTIYKYTKFGKSYSNNAEEFFYKFISEHKDELETIKSVAKKIKSLGFNKIIYGEKLDFTDGEYELNEFYNYDFEYLENMEIIPTYETDSIKYKTNGSCYCMNIYLSKLWDSGILIKRDGEIELNSLIFDPNRLPNEITYDSTIGNINKLVTSSSKEIRKIQNVVDMSIYTDDLISQYNRTKEMIDSIEESKDKEQLKQILFNISKELEELKKVGTSFEKKVIDSSDNISSEMIEKEKQHYLDRRRTSRNDLV